MITPHVTLVRRAADLVLHYDKTPGQAARILGCSIPVVQQCIQHYLDRHPPGSNPSPPTEVESPFVSVLLDEDPVAAASSPSVPLDILTPSGLTLRLQLSSLQDVVTLLQSLEVKPC